MSSGLAIFVKTPTFSPVKTRLVRDVGQLRAEAFYLSSAEAVASVAQQVPGERSLTAYWAVAETQAMNSAIWADLPKLPQGVGNLGERMEQVYRLIRCRHANALLVGADAPQLTNALLSQALDWLAKPGPRLVIGRAEDGGFWIFGGNCNLPSQVWTQAQYSMPKTYEQFVSAMLPFGEFLALPVLADVDYATDLAIVRGQLQQLQSPTEAQQRLTHWLEDWASLGSTTP